MRTIAILILCLAVISTARAEDGVKPFEAHEALKSAGVDYPTESVERAKEQPKSTVECVVDRARSAAEGRTVVICSEK